MFVVYWCILVIWHSIHADGFHNDRICVITALWWFRNQVLNKIQRFCISFLISHRCPYWCHHDIIIGVFSFPQIICAIRNAQKMINCVWYNNILEMTATQGMVIIIHFCWLKLRTVIWTSFNWGLNVNYNFYADNTLELWHLCLKPSCY